MTMMCQGAHVDNVAPDKPRLYSYRNNDFQFHRGEGFNKIFTNLQEKVWYLTIHCKQLSRIHCNFYIVRASCFLHYS